MMCQSNKLPPLPPAAVAVMLVVLLLFAHDGSGNDTVSVSGSLMVLVVEPGQLWASFTSIVCGPAARLPKVSPDTQAANRPPSLLQVYGPVPPEMVTVMLPSLPPLQLTSTFVELTTSASGSPIVFEVLPGQLWASFTSIVCGPAARLPKVSPDTQAANRPPSLLQVYGPVPPEMVTVMLPSLPPLQLTSTFVELTTSASGSPIVFEVLPVQVLLSLTVTVWGPVESDPKVSPELQLLNAPPSRLQVNGPVPLVIVTVMLPSPLPLQLTSVLVDVAVTWSTVNTAHLVSPGDPQLLLLVTTTQTSWFPALRPVVSMAMLEVVAVLVTPVDVFVPSIFHWKLSVPLPVAVVEKVAVLPLHTV